MRVAPHGGRVLEYTDKGKSLVDFSANINPWGPPLVLQEAWDDLFRYVSVYPPLNIDYHRRLLASLYNIPAGVILPCNGASQGIYLLARELPLQRVAICEPMFTEYARAFSRQGREVIHHFHFPGSDPARFFDLLFRQRYDAIVAGNPGNPAGTTFPEWLWEDLVERCDEEGSWLLVDEAFQEFMGEETSLSSHVLERKKLVVIRSLTKYYSLAGLRGGFLVAHPDLVRNIEGALEPWSVNALLSKALDLLASADLSFFHRTTREKLAEEKAFLEQGMEKPGILERLCSSKVNFYLARLKNENQGFFDFLKERGIVIRDCSDFYGLSDGNWFRFAVRARRENHLLLEAVKEYVRNKQ